MKLVTQDFVYLLKKMSLTIGINGISNEGILLVEVSVFFPTGFEMYTGDFTLIRGLPGSHRKCS